MCSDYTVYTAATCYSHYQKYSFIPRLLCKSRESMFLPSPVKYSFIPRLPCKSGESMFLPSPVKYSFIPRLPYKSGESMFLVLIKLLPSNLQESCIS